MLEGDWGRLTRGLRLVKAMRVAVVGRRSIRSSSCVSIPAESVALFCGWARSTPIASAGSLRRTMRIVLPPCVTGESRAGKLLC